MPILCVITLLIGALIGMFVERWGWHRRLKEKADNGFRLACNGSLYIIRHPLKPSEVDSICERCRRRLEDAADINERRS